MTLHPPRPSAPDDRPPASGAVPSWAADAAEAGPLRPQFAPLPRQLALFPPDELPPAPTPAPPRRARLPGRIKALLNVIERPRAEPPAAGSTSSWPDSFFDDQAGA